ncbi:MAG: bifunctional nuclease family protein [Acidimicrobiia bacterium]|nr:bifunctional nuclease family protein [Acidimicrobiia bacterium]
MVEMELVGVRVEVPSNVPIVLLREREGARRMLQIFIGGPEATAIAVALEGIEPRRPLTHDLVRILLEELGAVLDQVIITHVADSVFYSDLHIGVTGGTHVVSARPSDALALAIRVGASIHASEEVLAEAGFVEASADEPDDVVEQFKEFIDSVDPEDFAS